MPRYLDRRYLDSSGDAWDGEIDDDETEPLHYCPHGVEVPTPGGACDRCATEDADDSQGTLW